MIIWTGYGFLSPLIPMAGYAGVVKLCQKTYGLNYTQSHSWPGALGTALGAVVLWMVAEKLSPPLRTLVDTATGETVVMKRKNTFFFIPMNYFAGLMVLVAGWMLLFKPDSPL
jgi:hypothetical protein